MKIISMNMRSIIFIILSIVMLTSCEKDSEQEVFNKKIKIEAVYFTENIPNEGKPDIKSRVFIYYNLESIAFINYTYFKDGMFINSTDTIKPVCTDTINTLGYSIIEPMYTEKYITIAVESYYYKGRISLDSFILNEMLPISFKIENKP